MHLPWCDSFTPITKHLLKAFKKDGAASKCWRKHLSSSIPWQLRVKLHWLHMRRHIPSPLSYMVDSMILIMIPHAEDVLILGNMVGGETHLWNVSLGKGVSHILCTTCYRGSMGDHMATIAHYLSLYDVDHMIVCSTWSMPLMGIWEELHYELPC